MLKNRDQSYEEYVLARMLVMRRTAYLLTSDWHAADDLVAATLVKVYRRWRKIEKMASPDPYVRRMLIHTWLDDRRRPWRREHTTTELPERAGADEMGRITDRIVLLQVLADLPPRRRAVLVLRYFCDLSVEETADELGVSVGTLKPCYPPNG